MENATLPASYPLSRTDPLNPPEGYAALRAEMPIARVRLDFDGSLVWLITRYDDARTVLGDPRFSSDFSRPGFPARLTSQPPGPGTFIRMDPPDHARLRQPLVREFMHKPVAALRPAIQRIADELIDAMTSKAPPADLVGEFALPLPSLVITALLGVPYADRDFFHETTKVMGDQGVDPQRRLAVRNELKAYLDKLVEAKQRTPADDLLSRLARAKEQAGLTHDEVVGIATLLMVAGYETVANQIGVGMLVLLRHPGQLAEVRGNPEVLSRAVEEIIRHQTVIDYGARRVATADVEVGGQLIRAGEGVLVVLASANRDAEVFADPDRFDIHRAARDHLSFGHGPHHCLGQSLARAQLEVALGTLLRRVPTLRLAVGAADVVYRSDMFVYGVHQLPVTW